MLSPRVAGLCLVALLAGCASSGSRNDAGPDGAASLSSSSSSSLPAAKSGDSCRSNRSSCLYNGAYESGERNYAQQAAAKLNLAELQRLKSAFGQ
ncbi:hypothetical protein C7R54_13340 [Achromobacter aloeverae]|uniref:Lipoprotein n=1 Tax=Achromobacter aloeverae TaxID=1750518 RepID=A0A4Q1HLF9_9BURK|nr:hypothetical protein C7R54_13340 [Achromobacter aloeverae]